MKVLIFLFALFISSIANSEIIFNDPTGKSLNNYVSSLSKEEIINGLEESGGKDEYILGLLYLRGYSKFRISKDCKRSIDLLNDAWSKGVVDAGYTLAAINYLGECKNKNIGKSKYLAHKTAKSGYILSQRMLGRSYWGREWKGLNSKNMGKAIFWLKKAGDAGDRQSAGNLSYIYREGVGVNRDERKSFLWLKKAAFSKFEAGETIIFPSLAEYYEKGLGTEKDLIKAYKYYDLSGTAGVEGKQRVAKEMTQEQIDEAIRQSQAWQEEHNVQVGGGFIRRVK